MSVDCDQISDLEYTHVIQFIHPVNKQERLCDNPEFIKTSS